MLQYIEDRDLWRWALRESREFSAGLGIPHDFQNFDAVVTSENGIAQTIAKVSTARESRRAKGFWSILKR